GRRGGAARDRRAVRSELAAAPVESIAELRARCAAHSAAAYTFIAVPALMFGAGAIGFFAVPYTIIIYPFAFLVFPKLWQVVKRHGFVTASDFIHARYGSSTLALAVAITGILSTMPYLALQLVGLQVVIG